MHFLRHTDDEYERDFTGERLGWTIYHDPSLAFRPVHRIEFHPEDGPIILLGDCVFEVDPEADPVYATDELAMDAFYNPAPTVPTGDKQGA